MVEVRQSTGAIRIHGVSCLLDGAGTIKLMTYYTSEASPQTDERVVSRRHPRKAPVACIESGMVNPRLNGTAVRRIAWPQRHPATGAAMSVPQTVAEVLSKHVVLEVESIDRMYLNVYVPQLQAVEGTLKFIRIHRGHKVASTHMVEPVHCFHQAVCQRQQNSSDCVPERASKDDFAKQQRKQFHKSEGVVFIGKAQEKCTVYRFFAPRNVATLRQNALIPGS